MPVQPVAALDEIYAVEDPWNYNETPDDSARTVRLLTALPNRRYHRVLDVGCGNAFVTLRLPGSEVLGLDISARAIEWARRRAAERPDSNRFSFEVCSIFDLDPFRLGRFDLVVLSGVLYPQYIGGGFSFIRIVVDNVLRSGGILASAHIDDWCLWRFPYTLFYADLSPYRQYVQRLELFEK
jgi:SAM-dependent methyltransferase